MGITVLIIAYKRPEYLSRVLESLKHIEIDELLISYDCPSDIDRHLVYDSISMGFNYSFDKKIINTENNKTLGCKGHVLKALNWAIKVATNDFILILEDDILVTEKTADRVNNYVNTYDRNKPSILKLNDYFWGWVAHRDIINM
jgi:hypothetical protein